MAQVTGTSHNACTGSRAGNRHFITDDIIPVNVRNFMSF